MPPPNLPAFQLAIQFSVMQALITDNKQLHLELDTVEKETVRLALELNKNVLPIGLTLVSDEKESSNNEGKTDEVELTTGGVSLISIIDFFVEENNSLHEKLAKSKKHQEELRAKLDAELSQSAGASRQTKKSRID